MQVYNKIDQKIHQLAQTIAKFNRSYGVKKIDDSHTNLAFDKIGMRLLGRWVDSSKGKVIMSLNLVDFKFDIYNQLWESLFSTKIKGKTQVEIEATIKEFLPHLDLDESTFTQPLHFEITKYDFIDQAYSKWKKKDIKNWAKQRALANDACLWLLNHLQIDAEIRIWPHHFDTGIYIEPTSKIGLGFGLAMQDNLINKPYFYYSAYGLNGNNFDYKSTKKLKKGTWLIENWKGAVLDISTAKRKNLEAFLKEVTLQYFS